MKRITAMLLMTILLLTFSSMSFSDGPVSTHGGTAKTTLKYSVAEHFLVEIPPEMNFSGDTATMQVNLTGNVDGIINVSVTSYNYTQHNVIAMLKGDETSNNINYDFYIGETQITEFPAYFQLSLDNDQNFQTFKAVISSPEYAQKFADKGDYYDYFTFTVS